MCHASRVTCHKSCVKCHMPHATCHLPPVTNAKSYNNIHSLVNSLIISSKGRSRCQNLKTVSVTHHESMQISWLKVSRTKIDKHIHIHTEKHGNAMTDPAQSQSRWHSNNGNSIIFNFKGHCALQLLFKPMVKTFRALYCQNWGKYLKIRGTNTKEHFFRFKVNISKFQTPFTTSKTFYEHHGLQ